MVNNYIRIAIFSQLIYYVLLFFRPSSFLVINIFWRLQSMVLLLNHDYIKAYYLFLIKHNKMCDKNIIRFFCPYTPNFSALLCKMQII